MTELKLKKTNSPSTPQAAPTSADPGPIRLLYLRSDQASFQSSPSEKTWLVEKVVSNDRRHLVSVKSVNIAHLHPNLPNGLYVSIPSRTVEVPAGNWNATMLCHYLNEQLVPDGITMSWCHATYRFFFEPSITLLSDSIGLSYLGFEEGVDHIDVTCSDFPMNLAGAQRVQIWSNLSINNLPVNGLLASIPILCDYGDIIRYDDSTGAEGSLVLDYAIHKISIRLTDEYGNTLQCDDNIPWSICLSLQEVGHDGFIPAEIHLKTLKDYSNLE